MRVIGGSLVKLREAEEEVQGAGDVYPSPPLRVVHILLCTTCSGLLKTALNNALLPTLFNVVNNSVQHC